MTSPVVSAHMVSPVEPGFMLTLEPASTEDLPVVMAEPLKTNKEGLGVVKIKDTEFVPEGFHESLEEDGGIKVTEKNEHLLINTARLEKMHKESGWATEKGKVYTPEMTGFTPSEEEILNLKMKGYVLRGRIVCSSGRVANEDMENELSSITQEDVQSSINDGERALEWFYSHQREHLHPPQKFKINDVTINDAEVITGEEARFPHGEYLLHDKTSRKNSLELMVFTMCDNPSCLKMSSIMLQLCAMGILHKEDKDCAMEYLKTRNIYHINDPVNGNTDICQRCIGDIGAIVD
jgi:hypothetical protein